MDIPIAEFSDLDRQKKKLAALLEKCSLDDNNSITHALLMAEKAHEGQKRNDGTPFVIHPIRCAIMLMAELGVDDPDMISIALLHDVVEDTPTTLDEVQQQFGEQIATMVDHLTRPRPTDEREEEKMERKAVKFKELMKQDADTRLVKCTDMVDNYRDCAIYADLPAVRIMIPRLLVEADRYGTPLAEMTDPRVAKAFRAAVEKLRTSVH
jgi:(p)ppGpp synthase/HD superfamily hydrolase